ncbi:MAG: histidine--tRNA ligase [Clostridia bacterium]|nr:histidine--tRNA ligase [Clostridia bacterium]
MALVTKSIKGTQDTLPSESYKIQFVEQSVLEIAKNYGYKEIRVPVFEHTELFQRGVGDTTDVVQKEMYTFEDKGGRSITLRPEGTAGVVRSYIEHGLFNEAQPQKVCYLISCYRYEKPQAGRLREFHQFGCECFGTASPAADAELISLVNDIFAFLDVKNLKIQINSIGCPECRKHYHKALQEYFESKKEELCGTCLGRLERNPMRILDCKSPVCSEIAKDAPKVTDYLCDECHDHFQKVQQYLDAMNIPYEVNPSIVRGLDYYTKTVFEFVSTEIGAQGTVCGGGRYDGLVEEIGGNHTPALGFAMGMERLLLLMQAQGIEFPPEAKCDLYIASMGENATLKASQIASDVRGNGMHAQFDIVGRSVKAQMKYANKIGAAYTVVLGDSEIEAGVAKVKNMADGSETEMKIDDIAEEIMRLSINDSLKGFEVEGLDISTLM